MNSAPLPRSAKIALTILFWTARLTAVASILTLILFFTGEGFNFGTVRPQEWVGMAFFPGGVLLGLLVGWLNEKAGGWMVVGSLLGFYLLYGLLLTGRLPGLWAFLVFGFPGLFYLAHAYLKNPISH